jgi:hypothetical protein
MGRLLIMSVMDILINSIASESSASVVPLAVSAGLKNECDLAITSSFSSASI